MNICVPVLEDEGMKSRLSPHFGSAPFFAIADTVTGNHRTIRNQNEAHQHGMCNPLNAIRGERIDVLVVGGIGGGALSKLQAVGIAVMSANSPTLGEIIAEYKAGALHEINPEMACTHGHGAKNHDSRDHAHGDACCHG